MVLNGGSVSRYPAPDLITHLPNAPETVPGFLHDLIFPGARELVGSAAVGSDHGEGELFVEGDFLAVESEFHASGGYGGSRRGDCRQYRQYRQT